MRTLSDVEILRIIRAVTGKPMHLWHIEVIEDLGIEEVVVVL